MANKVGREVLDNTILDGLDSLYTAHAYISSLAKESPDWSLVSWQLYQYIQASETAYRAMTGMGRTRGIVDRDLVARLVEAARRRDLAEASEIADSLYEAARKLDAVNGIAYRHICGLRLLVVASVFVALAGLVSVSGIPVVLAGAFLAGLGVSSIFGCFTPYSRRVLVASLLGFLALEAYQVIEGSVSWPAYVASITAWLIMLGGYIEELSLLGLYEMFGRLIGDTRTSINTSLPAQHTHDVEGGEEGDGEEVRGPDIHSGGGPGAGHKQG